MSGRDPNAVKHDIMKAVQTACNDDVTEPGTEARRRHNERVSAMLAAIDEIERLRAIEHAARNVATTLRGGFVVCQSCGEQEDTTDVDYARELYAALTRVAKP